MPLKDPELQKKYWNSWYANSKAAREKQRAAVKERKKEIHTWYKERKKKYACVQCGKKGIACLDFHHKDKSEKFLGIHRMANIGYSKERILEEISKCDVLCANCHIAHHTKDKMKPSSSDKYKKRKAKRIEMYAFVDTYKELHGCSLCPTNNPIHLEFHHIVRLPGKSRTISKMISDGYSKKRIFEEIEKCDVLCRNCHRELHATENGATQI